MVVNKENWAKGEWDNELDFYEFDDPDTFYTCFIIRGPGGQLNGYVALESSNHLYGKDYNDIDVNVHGGLTFSSDGLQMKMNCTFAEFKSLNDSDWVIGFDTAHLGDITPKYEKEMGRLELKFDYTSTYKNVDYVKKELSDLCRQLGEFDPKIIGYKRKQI